MLDPSTPAANAKEQTLGLLSTFLKIPRERIAAEAEVLDREAIQAKRHWLVERRAALNAAVAEAMRVHQEWRVVAEHRVAELRKTFEAARKALNEAASQLFDVEREAQSAGLAHKHEVALIDAELTATADARIAACIRELDAECDQLMRNGLVTYEEKQRLSDAVRVRSNAPMVNARLAAMRQAMKDAEALKILALTPEEMVDRLAALRAGLPPVSGLAPTSGWESVEPWMAPPAKVAPHGPRPEDLKPPKGGWWKPRRRAE